MSISDFVENKNKLKPVVLQYTVKSPETLESLSHKIYKCDSNEWKKTVWILRQASQAPVNYYYDWIFGPVADGGLSSANFDKIQAFSGKNQIAFCSEEAIKQLRLTEVIPCQH